MANVRPVCLESYGGPARVGQTATVVGWGSLRENGPQPDILQEITVKIWDNKECKDTYGPAAPGGIMDHMLCAGQAGKDSCSVSRPGHYGLTGRWVQKFNGSCLLCFLHSALVFKGRGQCDHHAFPLA